MGLSTYGKDNPMTGLNTRTEDILSRIDEVIDFAVEHHIGMIVHTGDVFNTKNPSQIVVHAFYERIKRMQDNNITFVCLLGNHDCSKLATTKHSLEIAKILELPNTHITRGDEYFDLGYVQFVALNYWTPLADISSHLEELSKRVDFCRPVILLAHLQIEYENSPGAFLETLPSVPVSVLTSYPWNLVLVGHIHRRQILNESPPAMYVGSIGPHSFNEEGDEKGFLEFRFSDDKFVKSTFHPLSGIQLKTLRGTMKDIEVQLEKTSYENHIVRLILAADEPIDEGFLKERLSNAFKYVVQKEKSTKKMVRNVPSKIFSPNEFLSAFFDKDPMKKEIEELAKEIMT